MARVIGRGVWHAVLPIVGGLVVAAAMTAVLVSARPPDAGGIVRFGVVAALSLVIMGVRPVRRALIRARDGR